MKGKKWGLMPDSYSEDLKERAVKYVEDGHNYNEAAIIFKVSNTSMRRWHKQYLELGHFKAKKRLGKKPRILLSVFEEYVRANPDKTLKEIGDYFNMSDVGALYYMRKIGFRYKKKSPVIGKQVMGKSKNTWKP